MEKKEEFKPAHEIVVDNFFIFLNESGKTMKEYASDNNIDRTTLSKWRSGVTSMTVDQIKSAAIYFGKTVNDFYYSKEEKKKLEVLSDKNYHPVMAQQSISVNDYAKYFNNPFKAITEQIYLIFAFTLISCFFSLLHPSLLAIALIYPCYLSYKIDIKDNYYKKKTFIINYLDDIYYKMDDNKNHQFYSVNILSLLAIGLLLILTINQYYTAKASIGNLKIYLYIFFSVSILFMVILSSIFSEFEKEFKKEIYDNELKVYYLGFAILAISIFYLGMAIAATIMSVGLFYYIIIAFVVLVLSLIIFYLINKELKRYHLCYDNGVDVVELFKKNKK